MFVFPSMLSPTNQRRRSRWITAASSFSSQPVLRMDPTLRSCGLRKPWLGGNRMPSKASVV